jgi:asparagine synthase (glutamine-hydrolysing)
VGVYLSGGLDSSLVAALAARRAPGLASFSVTFDDPGLDESRWQRAVAHQAGLRHHELRFRSEEIGDRLAEMVRHAECPVKETYNVCAMALAEAAREAGVRVVLGGEGADELFAGYAGYKVEQHGRGAAPALDRALEEGLNRRLWGAPLRYERDLQAHRALRAELYSEDLQAELRRFDCTRGPLLDAAMLRGRHPLHQRSYLDVKLRLGEHLLGDHGDRMAMSRGVEARFPFLDGEVVDFARRLPPDLKLKGYREKHIVREVAARHLPPSVLAREKFGFHAPGSPALLQAGLPWVAELLAPARIARDGVWSPAAVSWLVQRNTQPGFRLDLPFEEDLLLVVLTFNLLLDELQLSGLS